MELYRSYGQRDVTSTTLNQRGLGTQTLRQRWHGELARPAGREAAFTALADPTRRAIVARLARGDATVNELAAPFDLTLPGISKHLKVLERCGLISRTRRAQFRPCHLEAPCSTRR